MATSDEFSSTYFELVRTETTTGALFAKLGELVELTIGTRLFTASVFDMATRRSRRVYSDNTAAYPVGGFKPISEGKWEDTVLKRHEVFSSTSIEGIAEVFFDWELIQSLGCESNANIPVVVGGDVIGTLNLLHEAGYYTPQRLRGYEQLLPYATVAFLVAQRAKSTFEAVAA